MSEGAIGIFDSGVGGLSILWEAKRKIKGENFIYAFDRSHAPYGNRSDGFIKKRALRLTRELIRRGAKLVVIACNTATATAIDYVRSKVSVPVIGVEPPLKQAYYAGGKTLVLCTGATARQRRFKTLLMQYGKDAVVSPQPVLASKIEQCFTDLPSLNEYLAYALPKDEGFENVVLGCTHYYHIASQIKKLYGDKPRIFTAADGTVRRIAQVLKEKDLCAQKAKGLVKFIYL